MPPLAMHNDPDLPDDESLTPEPMFLEKDGPSRREGHDEAKAAPSPPRGWSLPRRYLFRFGLLYFLLYSAPFPITSIPNPQSVETVFEADWAWVDSVQPAYKALNRYAGAVRDGEWKAVDWAAKNVLELEDPLARPYGSGDPTHEYIKILVMLALAGAGTLVWSIFDRRRRAHDRLAPWLHLGVRYWLAFSMLTYGIIKVIPTQMRFPSPSRLVTEYGHSSPMNVLWTFMGASPSYTIFSGAGELLAGLLLCFRRTSTLGGLVAMGVMANVVAMNFSYDVPVKLFSSHLFLAGMVVCLPDTQRLLNTLILNRTGTPRDLSRPRLHVAGHLLRFLVIGTTLLTGFHRSIGFYRTMQEKPDLYGIWVVDDYQLDGVAVPPLATDGQRWQRFLVDSASSGSIQGMDDRMHRCSIAVKQEGAGPLTLDQSSVWKYELGPDGALSLEGEFLWSMKEVPWDQSLPTHYKDPRLSVRMERVSAGDETTETEAIPGVLSVTEQLIGVWQTKAVDRMGEPLTSRRSDPGGDWTHLEFMGEATVSVTFPGGRQDVYGVTVDEDAGTLTFSTQAALEMERAGEDHLVLRGELRGHQVTISLERRPLDDYLLVGRSFHWINEIPLNRY